MYKQGRINKLVVYSLIDKFYAKFNDAIVSNF